MIPGFITLDGRRYKILPLNLKLFAKVGAELDRLAAKGWPDDPRAIFGSVLKIVRKACPSVPNKTWKNVPASEIAAALASVLEFWGLGREEKKLTG